MDRIFKMAVIFVACFAISACSSDAEKKISHFEKGKAYFEEGEYKSAELEFKNAIQIDSQYVDAYMTLAETSLKLGNPQGAFNAYIEIDPRAVKQCLALVGFYVT